MARERRRRERGRDKEGVERRGVSLSQNKQSYISLCVCVCLCVCVLQFACEECRTVFDFAGDHYIPIEDAVTEVSNELMGFPNMEVSLSLWLDQLGCRYMCVCVLMSSCMHT